MDQQTLNQNIAAARARGVPESIIQARVQQIQQGIDIPGASASSGMPPSVTQPSLSLTPSPAPTASAQVALPIQQNINQQTAPQQQQPNALQSFLTNTIGGAGNILHNILSGPTGGPAGNLLAAVAPKNALDILPTVGAVGGGFIPVLGETGIGEAGGAAAGQAVEDLIQGKTPGWDVPITGGITGVTGGATRLAGSLLGKIFTGAGEDLATGGLNMTKGQLAKFAKEYGQPLQNVLRNNGLAGADTETLQSGIDALDKQYDAIANSTDVNVDPNTFLKNVQDAKNFLLNPTGGENPGVIPTSATKKVAALESELQNSGAYKKFGITQNDDGSYNIDPNADPVKMKDVQQIKKSFDNQTTPGDFSADPGQYSINRLGGNIFRKTLNDTADNAVIEGNPTQLLAPNGQTLGGLGRTLMMLKDAQDVAQNRVGVGNTALQPFGWGNEVLGGLGASAAAAAGLNPLTGLLLPGMRIADRLIRGNPAAAGFVSGADTAIGKGLQGIIPALSTTAAAGAAGIAGMLQNNGSVPNTQGGGNNGNQGNNNQGNQQNTQPPSSTASINGNGTSVNGQPNIVQQNVNGITIPIDKSTGHMVLPDLNQSITQIPGLPYDEQKINQAIAQYGNNPFVMPKIQAAIQANDRAKALYLQNHALDGSEVSFMHSAGAYNDQISQLQELLSKQGNRDILNSMANDNPLIQAAKAKLDPTGDYAQMLTLMNSLRGQSAKQSVGGRLSNFDVQFFSNFPAPGDTAAAADKKIKAAQAKLYDTYSRLYPAYGLTMNAAQMQQAQQPAQQIQASPYQNFNALQQTLYPAAQGGGQ